MFTSTMTHEEILHEAKLDFYELKPRMEIAFGQFRRNYSTRWEGPQEKNRNLTSCFSEKKMFRTRRHNTWTFEMHVNGYREHHIIAGSLAYIPLQRNNGNVEYLCLRLRDVFDPELLTSHFIQRYKERYLEPNKVNLLGLPAAIYFERKSGDLQPTDFIPDNWTDEDLRTKRIWISAQGLVVTVAKGELRVFVTFLDQKNLSRYKAMIYEEEEQMRMYERSNAAKNWFDQVMILKQIFTAPNARKIQERYVRRTTDMTRPDAQKLIDKSMQAWDNLESVTRLIWEKIDNYTDKERELVRTKLHPEIGEKINVFDLVHNRTELNP